jgi:hypothetical protein
MGVSLRPRAPALAALAALMLMLPAPQPTVATPPPAHDEDATAKELMQWLTDNAAEVGQRGAASFYRGMEYALQGGIQRWHACLSMFGPPTPIVQL